MLESFAFLTFMMTSTSNHGNYHYPVLFFTSLIENYVHTRFHSYTISLSGDMERGKNSSPLRSIIGVKGCMFVIWLALL